MQRWWWWLFYENEKEEEWGSMKKRLTMNSSFFTAHTHIFQPIIIVFKFQDTRSVASTTSICVLFMCNALHSVLHVCMFDLKLDMCEMYTYISYYSAILRSDCVCHKNYFGSSSTYQLGQRAHISFETSFFSHGYGVNFVSECVCVYVYKFL